jgi:hypothetical protein
VQAPLEDVTGRLVPLIRRHRPDVVVTYDAHGGYGHPDHIMAHRVTMASVAAAAVADRFPQGDALWQVRKVYAVVWPQSVVLQAIQVMRVLESCRLPTPLRELHVDPTVVGCPDACGDHHTHRCTVGAAGEMGGLRCPPESNGPPGEFRLVGLAGEPLALAC